MLATWFVCCMQDYLAKQSGTATFEATPGPIQVSINQYWQYAKTAVEENPLYLFDRWFHQNVDGIRNDWEVPLYFQDDLFALLGEDTRPDYRWMIIGAPHSGSNFHVDPNGTAAWNACITGAKKWILFPPGQIPPAVRQSADGAEVTTTVSLVEWFLNYYPATRDLDPEKRPIECIQRAGEVIFVPSGWWHCALNLDESGNGDPIIAVTQNFATRANLPQVRRFLRDKPDQASGCEDACKLGPKLDAALAKHRPEVLEECDAVYAKEAAAAEEAARNKKPQLWEVLTSGSGSGSGSSGGSSSASSNGNVADGAGNGSSSGRGSSSSSTGTGGGGGFSFGF